MAVDACTKATAFSAGGLGDRDFAFASAFIGFKCFIYTVDLQYGYLNFIVDGDALRSVGLVWEKKTLLDAP